MEETAFQIFVSPSGNDSNAGTEQKPFVSLQRALKECRNHTEESVIINLREGTYTLNDPLVFTQEDSNIKGKLRIWKAFNHEKVIISGANPLQAVWNQIHENSQIYSTILSKDQYNQTKSWPIDMLVMNNQILQMARYPKFPGTYNIKAQPLPKPLDLLDRIKNWKNPVHGIVHGLQHSEWGSVHYEITGKDSTGKLILKGGDQINRASRLHPKYYYIENIREELDSPGEWFFDNNSGELFVIPPDNLDINTAKIEIVHNSTLIELKGSQTLLLKNIHFQNLIFTHTARTILTPFEPLLRGDWSICRTGTFVVEGTQDCRIENCQFTELGGNGIFLSGFNRETKIIGCKFTHLGESAICVVGHMEAVRSPSVEYRKSLPWNQIDLTPGPKSENYPQNCIIQNNLIHDIGLINKQTAAIFLSMAEQILILHNTMYRMPRAGICINDGCWGGHTIQDNDIFDTVRESGDHGPFNSWGRDRHWQTVRHENNPKEELQAKKFSKLDCWKEILIDHNRFDHRRGHCWGIDLDDGSSHFRITNNLTIGISLKLREGFYRTVENNIFISPFPLAKHASYCQNEDIIRKNILYNTLKASAWESVRARFSDSKEIDNNLYYSSKGKISLWKYRWKGIEHHSISQDPEFCDMKNRNYQVKPSSPALKLGFKNFSMNGFGVEKREFQIETNQAYSEYMMEKSGVKEDQQSSKNESRKWLGAIIKSISTEAEQSAFGLPGVTGIRFIKIPSKSAAQKSGFLVDDVILNIDTHEVLNIESLNRILSKNDHQPHSLIFMRQQQERQVIIKE